MLVHYSIPNPLVFESEALPFLLQSHPGVLDELVARGWISREVHDPEYRGSSWESFFSGTLLQGEYTDYIPTEELARAFAYYSGSYPVVPTAKEVHAAVSDSNYLLGLKYVRGVRPRGNNNISQNKRCYQYLKFRPDFRSLLDAHLQEEEGTDV